MNNEMKKRLSGCLLCGAIGDALGAKFEGKSNIYEIDFDFPWTVTDDTQLTLATCESLIENKAILPERVALTFLKWFNERKLTGLGASTLKALQELQFGGHWALVGRQGEFAAGNGAAMRIAPLAFKKNVSRTLIKDLCIITHKNDEAYVGALSVYLSVKFALDGTWTEDENLLDLIIKEIPDTNVRDRLIELNDLQDYSIESLKDKYKTSGYVVDSVPFSIFAAQKIKESDLESIFKSLIKLGGDTDTICSMTGQIIGSLKGEIVIPEKWKSRLESLHYYQMIRDIVSKWKL